MRRAGYTSAAARLRDTAHKKKERADRSTRPFKLAGYRLAAILSVMLLAIDPRRFMIRFAVQSRTLGRGHDSIGLGTRLVQIEPSFADTQAPGFGSREFTGLHTLVDARVLVGFALIQPRRAGGSGARKHHCEGQTNTCHEVRLLHVLSPAIRPEIGALAPNNGPAAVALTPTSSYHSRP